MHSGSAALHEKPITKASSAWWHWQTSRLPYCWPGNSARIASGAGIAVVSKLLRRALIAITADVDGLLIGPVVIRRGERCR